MMAFVVMMAMLLAAMIVRNWRTHRGAKDGAAGNGSSRGSGSPALEVPTFPTKRAGLGSDGDHKQPASPIQGFTENAVGSSTVLALNTQDFLRPENVLWPENLVVGVPFIDLALTLQGVPLCFGGLSEPFAFSSESPCLLLLKDVISSPLLSRAPIVVRAIDVASAWPRATGHRSESGACTWTRIGRCFDTRAAATDFSLQGNS